MKPIFTNHSNLAYTVGVDIPVSRETWLNDLRPSLNNDFKIDTSILSRSIGIIMKNSHINITFTIVRSPLFMFVFTTHALLQLIYP